MALLVGHAKGASASLPATVLSVGPESGSDAQWWYLTSDVAFFIDGDVGVADGQSWPANRGYRVPAGASFIWRRSWGRCCVAAVSDLGTIYGFGVNE